MSKIKERLLKALSKNNYMEAFIQSRSYHKNTAAYSQSAQLRLATHPASETQWERSLFQT